MATQPDTPIKGSWEDLLQNAQELAANFNDDAIPIFEKLVTRLGKMPAAQRHAADERLQNIYMQAAVELQRYLLMRERYDEALALIDLLEAEESDQAGEYWQKMRALVLVQAGRADETIAYLRSVAQQPGADLENWSALVMLQLKLEQLDDADDTLGQMDQWIEARYVEEEHPEARQRDVAVVELLRSMHAIDRGQWQAGVDHFQRAVELDSAQRDRLPEIYIRLLLSGRHEEAGSLIRRDQASQVRPNFWLGYSLLLSDDREKAVRHWEKALGADMSKPENQQFMEWVLSSYYLDDEAGVGLSTVLRALQEAESRYWMAFFLAGLGWALRDNVESARTNLETAVLGCRVAVDGRLLPPELWVHFETLLPAAMQAELIEFFDINTDTAINAESTSAVDESGENATSVEADVEHE